jgi:hypothetical protein
LESLITAELTPKVKKSVGETVSEHFGASSNTISNEDYKIFFCWWGCGSI